MNSDLDIIEQAARRLEQLRGAGIEMPVQRQSSGVRANPRAPDTKPQLDFFSNSSISPASGGQVGVSRSHPHPESRMLKLDFNVLSANGVITPNSDRSLFADELRVIKRPLIQNVLGKSAAPIKNANLIMITSAVPGEGKTHLAVNLAMSIAMELDHTVLLVDADVARPSVPGRLGFGQEKGLLDVLTWHIAAQGVAFEGKSLKLNEVMLRTNIEKLTLLPAGTQHPRATELLASDAMNRLLDEMAQRYSERIIIFDSPPLLVTTEARELASHMGQVILVVKAESTTQAMVKSAVATLENCPVKMVLLNQAAGSQGEHVYGYDYGYGYGYGSGPANKGAKRA